MYQALSMCPFNGMPAIHRYFRALSNQTNCRKQRNTPFTPSDGAVDTHTCCPCVPASRYLSIRPNKASRFFHGIREVTWIVCCFRARVTLLRCVIPRAVCTHVRVRAERKYIGEGRARMGTPVFRRALSGDKRREECNK